MFCIKYHKRAIRQIKRLPINERKKITRKIGLLKKVPPTGSLDIKKYHKTKNCWRLRIGRIRVIYQVNTNKKFILIKKVGFRGNIYRN